MSASYNGRENADGSENLTVKITVGGFDDANEMMKAFDLAKNGKLLGLFEKALHGQTELPSGEKETKKEKASKKA